MSAINWRYLQVPAGSDAASWSADQVWDELRSRSDDALDTYTARACRGSGARNTSRTG